MRALGPSLAVLAVALSTASARAAERSGEAWLEALRARVAADAAAGRPIVVQAHVALCDNAVIRCGGHGLGDGDSLEKNLYWATSGGMRGWMERRGSGWKRVHREGGGGREVRPGVLAVDVWKRAFPSPHARGGRPIDVYVVAFAWRGAAIDDAVRAYTADLFGDAPRTVTLDDGAVLEAGGAAHVVAWIGHDRWMDYDAFDWAGARRLARDGAPPKGTIAMACQTWQYLAGEIAAPSRVPLLFTRDFVFAGSHAFEGALSSFAAGGDLAAIRRAGALAYATGEKKPPGRVDYAFTNPADRRWRQAAR
jgi:hypothetical protein